VNAYGDRLHESRMRKSCTSGSTRGRGAAVIGPRAFHPVLPLSTLLAPFPDQSTIVNISLCKTGWLGFNGGMNSDLPTRPSLALLLLIILPAIALGANRSNAADADAQNLCRNGGFELLMEAAANPLPQDWSPVGAGTSRVVDVSSDAAEGKHSLHMSVRDADTVGANSTVMAVEHGLVRFRYKVLRSSAGGKNLALFAIALNGPAGLEVARQGFSPPPEHVGDGTWHQASFEFDFAAQQTSYCLLAPRINENVSAPGDGEWLLDDVQVIRVRAQAHVAVAFLWSGKPLARTGETIQFSAFVENTGGEDARDVAVKLSNSSAAITLPDSERHIACLPAGGYTRIDWNLTAAQSGPVEIEVTAGMEGANPESKS